MMFISPSSSIIFSTVFLILISNSISTATQFIFNGDFTSTNTLLFGTASIQSSILRLTNDTPFSIGRALYPFKIPTKFADSSFSFATSFIFSVSPLRNFLPGHGFAFLFTPSTGINGTSSAQHLGLFNFTNDGNSANHVFAIEFDSFRNQEFNDTDNNHIGVDVNSLVSINSSEAGVWSGEDDQVFEELTMNNGSNYQVWIEFVNSLVNVRIDRVGKKRPRKPLITQFVNLSEVFLDEMYLGFTASTGQLVQSHRILAWSFSTTNFSIGDALVTKNLPSFIVPNKADFKSKTLVVWVILGSCCWWWVSIAII